MTFGALLLVLETLFSSGNWNMFLTTVLRRAYLENQPKSCFEILENDFITIKYRNVHLFLNKKQFSENWFWKSNRRQEQLAENQEIIGNQSVNFLWQHQGIVKMPGLVVHLKIVRRAVLFFLKKYYFGNAGCPGR